LPLTVSSENKFLALDPEVREVGWPETTRWQP
jgi:hypothetical protein